VGTGDSFAAVVLAGGAASRFGGGKLLADWRGAPLLHAALSAARAAPVASITVVTGAQAEEIGRCVAAFDPGIRLVHAAEHAEGIAASLRAGIASLDRDVTGAFVFLGDMPRVPHAVLAPLASAVAQGAPAAAPTFAGRQGNPVVLGREIFGRVERLAGDIGARPILQDLGARVVLVEAPDEGVLFDVDERTDLSAL